jgi:hypothetical protein
VVSEVQAADAAPRERQGDRADAWNATRLPPKFGRWWPVELRVACRCAMFGHPHYHGKDSRIAAARKWNAEVRDEKDRVPYPEETW